MRPYRHPVHNRTVQELACFVVLLEGDGIRVVEVDVVVLRRGPTESFWDHFQVLGSHRLLE